MLTREDILEKLLEPYVTLTGEDIGAASALAARDAEVAEALRVCRALSGLSEAAVFGDPPTSDAVFLVSLRERITPSAPPVRAAFGSRRALAAASVTCAILVAVILGGGRVSGVSASSNEGAITSVAEAFDSPVALDVDSVAGVSADPDSFAVYLGLPDMAANWDFEQDTDEPVTDVLLGLDTQSLEEVLNTLEGTNFF
jgi:hypothetical protein